MHQRVQLQQNPGARLFQRLYMFRLQQERLSHVQRNLVRLHRSETVDLRPQYHELPLQRQLRFVVQCQQMHE